MMSVHKLSAGSGYTYLTRQTAAHDDLKAKGESLADYYSEKGEKPGRWVGSALTGVEGVDVGDQVTEDQMKALFGEGRHPNADQVEADYQAAGGDPVQAIEASQLGAPYRTLEDEPSPFLIETTRRYNQWLRDHGESRSGKVPAEVRQAIRTEVGQETFREMHGRDPLDARELSGHIARVSRPRRQTVAGYDLTFSPVKSVSVLWALADRGTSRQLEAAHDAAVADTLSWLESDVLFTRRGKGGVRHVDVTGMLATAFTHRDSRTGDPDLHTHVAVANKVQDPTDGAWLAIDGQVLFKATVAASERYNTALEREVNARLGWEFESREAAGKTGRPIRELAGIPDDLIGLFSSRRVDIEAKQAELAAAFRRDHGRAPIPKEAITLYQQATLATRDEKAAPRSVAEQRTAWADQAAAFLGSPRHVQAVVDTVASHAAARTTTLTNAQISDLAGQVIATVEASRARFQRPHLVAETQRAIRAKRLAPAVEADTVTRVVDACLTGHTRRIDPDDPVVEPEMMRRNSGQSVYDTPDAQLYTTDRITAAEADILAAARRVTTARVGDSAVAVALMEDLANNGPAGKALNSAQRQLVTEMATSGRAVQLALAPAGSGKTTAMRALAGVWAEQFPAHREGGGVVGLAPTAVASKELGESIGASSDSIAKLCWHLDHPDSSDPGWMKRIGRDTLLIIDEAGMAGTIDLAKVIRFATSRGASVRLIGDDQQLSSVSAGGVLRDIAADTGAVTLSELMRFTDPAEAAATLALRAGDTSALGFYLDNGRVRVTGDADQADVVYLDWKTATDQGHTSLMLAYSRDTVNELNARARADRIAEGAVTTGCEVALAGGLKASAGDVVVTRSNDRRLRMNATDFVKNGDRWTVVDAHQNGALTVKHHTLGRTITLPADYVADYVDLGYAATIHGAQGQTVHSSHLLLRGEEDRQLLYVALTRGTDLNAVYVPSGGDGDEHKNLHPDRIAPPTATEMLEQVLAHDGAQVSAHTEYRHQHDPRTLLGHAADRYADAVGVAALDAIGSERVAELTDQADQVVPGITSEPAWDTLAAHLAVLQLQGDDPIGRLAEAATNRELDTARDRAAVLDWRLDPTTGHSTGDGPLPWLTGIPDQLRRDSTYGPWLTARYQRVVDQAGAVGDLVATWTSETAPAWAVDLIGEQHLTADVARWRAAHKVPDEDTSPTGPHHPGVREARWQRRLTTRIRAVAGHRPAIENIFEAKLRPAAPAVLADPWWPVLAKRLALAHAARLPVDEHLDRALERPLPDDHPAAALWSRVGHGLLPAAAVAATAGSGATRLRPPWTSTLLAELPDGVGDRVLADGQWPTLVAAVDYAATSTRSDPRDIITRAVGFIGADHLPRPDGQPQAADAISAADLAAVLSWRVSDLTSEPPDEPPITEADLSDPDEQAFLARLAAEADAPFTTPDDEPPPVAPPPHPDDEPPVEDTDPTPLPATGVDRILDLTEAAGQFYADHYPDSPAQAHLVGRFGTDLTDSPWHVGYAPDAWDALTRHLQEHHDATPDELIDAGLAKYTRRGTLIDVFRNRAMIGLTDPDGTLLGFTGRDLGAPPAGADFTPPKYLNTPATAAFVKGRHLCGLHEGNAASGGDQAPGLVRVEGPMDAIAITLAGDGRMIGVFPGGTALTDQQADQIAVHSPGRTTWLALDRDTAGQHAAEDSFWKLTSRGMDVRSLILAAGKDPADLYADPDQRELLATLLALPEHAHSAVRDLIDATSADPTADFDHPETRIRASRRAGTLIAALPPEKWDDEITYAAGTFPTPSWEADPDQSREFDATQIYTTVLTRALHWTPAAGDRHDAIAPTGKLAALVEQLDQHTKASAARNDALRRLVETLESAETSETSATRAEQDQHETAESARPSRHDGPTLT